MRLPDIEQRLWVLDQRINAHGILVDRNLVEAAVDCFTLHRDRLLAEAIQLTGLENPNSRDQLLAWLQRAGEEGVTDLTKASVPRMLAATDNDVVRRVLEIRQELAKTSITKYEALLRATCDDGRCHDLMQFYGANRTGRWAGRLVQVQNLVGNKLKDLDLARQFLKARDYEAIEIGFGSVADTLAQLVRTSFIAPPGHRLIVVDFSAIEARVLAWLANCKWRMDVFASHGRIYESSAEQMFKLPAGSVTKKSPYRFKGKVAELACGYGGGVNALIKMGALDMGVEEKELQGLIDSWREANSEVCVFWYSIEKAAKAALLTGGAHVVKCFDGSVEVAFSARNGSLLMTLPSGRQLAYVGARIESEDLKVGEITIARAGSITYMGTDQRTRRWGRTSTWGGKLVENLTQAVARDCLRESMLRLDARGYQILMTVHDEIVLEVPNGFGSLAEVESAMAEPISWAPGLLLRGEGFESEYYKKDTD